MDSLAELNALIDEWDAADDARRIGSRPHSVGEHFAIERPLPARLPTEPFETGRLFTPRMDRFSQVTVRQNQYSVPIRLIGRTVRVLLHASKLVIFDGRREVARHCAGAEAGCAARLDRAGTGPRRRQVHPVHDAWWAAVRKIRGDAEGTRALIQVLLLHRGMAHEHVVAGIATALAAGALTPDAVAVEAAKLPKPTRSRSTAGHPSHPRHRLGRPRECGR
ncbi:hypothetical protein [Amycolatopsis sp. NPDC051061]|uniref:Mu transposase domain-containing protein n=1 Tax=Amycolatopsis sp. NPDC051061 TaxID=3155042 RepID=UPI00342DDF91